MRLWRATLAVSVLLGGCAAAPLVPYASHTACPPPCSEIPDKASLDREALRLAREATDALRAKRWAQANTQLNRALRIEPENAQLHFLNALAYHLGWRDGVQRDPELAETGYLLALRFDPTSAVAARQLGVLYVELKRFRDAAGMLARAIGLGAKDAESQYALAYSAYYAQEPMIAASAAQRAAALVPGDVQFIRAAALASAAAGDGEAASRYAGQAAKLVPAMAPVLRERLQDWETLHGELARTAAQAPAAPVQLAQAPPHGTPPPFPGGATRPGDSPMGGPGPMGRASGESAGPLQRKWSDCEQELARGSAFQGGGMGAGMGSLSGGSQGSADETTALSALPAPCKGLPLPRMAMVDVTILRTEDTRSSGQGVNLLEGLQVVLTGTRSVNRSTTSLPQRQVTQVGTLALPSAGVAYALNLANASDRNSEIIARPTLVALDRIPSMFFSGSNVSVVIPGTVSGGSLVDKPIGVSLSVTPTFVDDETLLLAVRATRSFIEAGATGTFQQALATTRNTVTANVMLKFDQTLVLSGLRERDQQETDGGVPLLRDIPGVQYMFGRRTTQDFTKQVVVTLTPRRPQHLADVILAGEQHRARSESNEPGRQAIGRARDEAAQALRRTPHMIAIVAGLSDNRFYAEFRTGDINTARIPRNFDLERTLREVWGLLLF